MSDEDWAALEAHFKDRRIQTGTGIRMLLIEYMKENKLLR
jgi:hypothetical protein